MPHGITGFEGSPEIGGSRRDVFSGGLLERGEGRDGFNLGPRFGSLIGGAPPAPVPFSQTPQFAQLLAQIQARRAAATAAVPAAPAAPAAPPALNIPATQPFQAPAIFQNQVPGVLPLLNAAAAPAAGANFGSLITGR